MMCNKTWTVIQFIDDSSVEAVPSTWIQGDVCHWPSFAPQKLHLAIKKCEPLNTCWPTHRVKVFRNATFDDYTKARTKAKLAEDTSDLQTENEEVTNTKRKRIQKILSSSDDSINDDSIDKSILKPPPNIKKFKTKNEETPKENTRQITKLWDASTGRPTSLDKDTEAPDHFEEVAVIFDPSKETENFYKGPANLLNNQNASEHGLQKPVSPNPSVSVCKSCGEKGKTFKTLIQQGYILRSLMVDTLTEVKELRKDLNTPRMSHTVTEVRSNFFTNPDFKFPVNEDEDLNKVELYLQTEDNLNNAALEISKLGGANNYDFVKRALKQIMTNDQALKYSWLGRKGKRTFQKLNLANLILRAAELNGLGSTRKVTENSVQLWLRRASDRRQQVEKKSNQG